MTDLPDTYISTQEYSVSCLMLDHPDWRHYRIRVVRVGQAWMVWDGVRYADATGEWDFRPEGDGLWLKRHRFTRAKALEIAQRMAPLMECNGRPVTDLL